MQLREWGDERRVGLLVVGLVVSALILPATSLAPPWTPDSMEHLAIANARLHGSGFVDPIQYNYFLEQTAPLPAFAVRAPVVPLLLMAPLAAGLDMRAIGILHALWTVVVAMLSYWGLSRFIPAWAAAAAMMLLNVSILRSTSPV